MKKLFVLIALTMLLTSISALATPKIGDYAEYDMNLSRDGMSLPGSYIQEVLAFDAASNTYNVKTIFQLQGGEANIQEEAKPADDFIDDMKIDVLLGSCADVGGTLETTQVPAGNFNTCKLLLEDSENTVWIWIAKVPFGFVKLDQTQKDGMHIILEMKNFR